MKVVCLKENLKTPILIAERVLGKNPTLPILGNFLITAEKGELKISSTDLEMGIHCWASCKIEREGSVSVSGKLFSSLINNFPDSKITLEKKDNSLIVTCEGQKTTLVSLETEEFPIIPKPNNAQTITIQAETLREALIGVVNAAATSDARVELQSIYINIQKDSIKVVSTDSFRLAEKTIPNQEKKNSPSLIIPLKTAHELIRIIEGKQTIIIHATKNQALFETQGAELFSRLIDGSFPDYEQIIPKKTETAVEIKKDELTSILRTAGLFSGKANDVTISVDPSKKEMVISSSSSDKGAYNATLNASIKGSQQEIGFNARFFLDGLSNLGSSHTHIEFNGDSAPAVLREKDGKDYFYLVMPIRKL